MLLPNRLKHPIALVLLISCSLMAGATDTAKKMQVMNGFVNLSDSIAVYKALYDNTPIEPVFKLMPRFAIVGFDNKFVFSVGAGLKFTASFDWNNPVHNPAGLSLSALQPYNMDDKFIYQMTAGGSGIYFNIIGFPNTANEIGLFISLGLDNESNNSYKVEAGQVYMRYRDFQLGYASSLYNDRGADAYTIDGSGPCASGAYSTVGINWQHFFNRHMRFGVGVELPNSSYTQIDPTQIQIVQGTPSSSSVSNQYVPNFPLYVGYAWGANNHVRLSALIKDVPYVDYISGQGHNQFGFGVKLTGHLVTGPLEWYWMGQYGYASSTAFKGDRGMGLDLVPDQHKVGKLVPTQTWGVIASGQWNITRKHIATLQYSFLRNHVPYYNIPADISFENQMHYGSTITGNFIWKISSLFNAGVEYRYVCKTFENGEFIDNNRVYLMLLMNF